MGSSSVLISSVAFSIGILVLLLATDRVPSRGKEEYFHKAMIMIVVELPVYERYALHARTRYVGCQLVTSFGILRS